MTPPPSNLDAPGRAPRVLVVDDEPGMRMTTSANFELEGFFVAEAESAEDALAKIASDEFDVVFTDIRMPGMTGIDLFRALRDAGNRVPVVLMTAFHDELPTRRALEDGVFTLLVKPFDMANAIRVVANAARGPVALIAAPGADAIASFLEDRGHAAARAETYAEAERRLRDEHVDVCVLDLDADGMDVAGLALQARGARPEMSLVGVADAPTSSRVSVDAIARRQPDLRDLVFTIARARSDPR